jgi:DNA-binding HxlR family transcriptional regulator
MPTFIDTQCDLPLFAAARRSDPQTAKAAGVASRAFASGHGGRILEALTAGPGTKDEISQRCGLTEQQVARRMHELRRRGLVVEVGEAVSPTGNLETRYGRSGNGNG